jgi:hypothetical protein
LRLLAVRLIVTEMKLNAALAKTLLMAASIGMVVPLLAQTSTPTTAPTTSQKPKTAPSTSTASKPAAAPTTPAKPAANSTTAAKAGATAKKGDPKAPVAAEEKKEIPGIKLKRANGTFLGLELEDGKYKLSFYNEKEEPVAPDIVRASARWNPVNKVGDQRTVLNPAPDGKSLKGAIFVQPPYAFKLFLTLLNEEGAAVETFTIDFHL